MGKKKPKNRWLESRILTNLHAEPSDTAVYQDPYGSLRKTVRLFSRATALDLAPCVRRIWLDGYYAAETTAEMFELLLQLPSLDYLSLPWMTLRHGTAEQWSRLLTTTTTQLSSLEFLAVSLKASQIESLNHQRVDQQTINTPLNSSAVDFHQLNRLKIVGDTNHLGLTDEDLTNMSRTMTNLHEIHITGTSSSSSSSGISIQGVMALVDSSQESLRVLEYSPSIDPGSSLPPSSLAHFHPCVQIQRCRQLRNLTITLPSICTDLFNPPASTGFSHWTGEIQIRTTSLCPSSPSSSSWQQTLHHARNLIETQTSLGINLSIEIYFRKPIHSLEPPVFPFPKPPNPSPPQTNLFPTNTEAYIFEPRLCLVHGPTAKLQQLLSSSPSASFRQEDEIWPSSKTPLNGPEWKPHDYRDHDDDDETQPSPYSYVTEWTLFSSLSFQT